MKARKILADPPWEFKAWDDKTGQDRGAASHYGTMTLDDICALPVSDIADDNCALFIWCVWHSIFDARQVIEAWGFIYRTLWCEWFKLNRSGIGWHVGMGYYTRSNSEPCLLAVKGKMPIAVHDERNYIVTYEDDEQAPQIFQGLPLAGAYVDPAPGGLPLIAPVRKHSEKPVEQYAKIERCYPEGDQVELFARRKQPGWWCLGNEVDGLDLALSIERLSDVGDV